MPRVHHRARIWFRWKRAQGRDCGLDTCLPARAPPSRSQAVRPNRRERKDRDHDSDFIGYDLAEVIDRQQRTKCQVGAGKGFRSALHAINDRYNLHDIAAGGSNRINSLER